MGREDRAVPPEEEPVAGQLADGFHREPLVDDPEQRALDGENRGPVGRGEARRARPAGGPMGDMLIDLYREFGSSLLTFRNLAAENEKLKRVEGKKEF